MMNRKHFAAIAITGTAILGATPATAFAGGSSSGSSSVPNLVIVKTDAQYTSNSALVGDDANAVFHVDKGAIFSGTTTDGGVTTDLATGTDWFQSQLESFGSTGDYMKQTFDTQTFSSRSVSVSEDAAPTGYDKVEGTATVHSQGDQWVADNLPTGVTLDYSGGYYWLNFHDHKIVYPTATTVTTTTPGTPAKTEQVVVPAHKMSLVQIDTYLNSYSNGRKFTTAGIKSRDAARAADKKAGRLLYRKGSASPVLWGSTRSTITMMDVCSLPGLASNQDAWMLGPGATVAAPWGVRGTVAQVSPNTVNCSSTTKTVTVSPAVPPVTVSSVVYVCPDGDKVPTADTECVSKTIGGSFG